MGNFPKHHIFGGILEIEKGNFEKFKIIIDLLEAIISCKFGLARMGKK